MSKNGVHRSTCNDRYVGKDVPDEIAFPMILKRLLARSKRTESGCLEWIGWRNYEGYGETSFRSHAHPTHRLMYMAVKGPIPEGMIIRHKCDNPPCMEPGHLLVGTEAENTADSIARKRHYRTAKTHCHKGHDLALHARINADGSRACRLCAKIRQSQPRVVSSKKPGYCGRGHRLVDNCYVSRRGYVECQTCRRNARTRFVARKRAASTQISKAERT